MCEFQHKVRMIIERLRKTRVFIVFILPCDQQSNSFSHLFGLFINENVTPQLPVLLTISSFFPLLVVVW